MSSEKKIFFTTKSLYEEISSFHEKNITEFSLHDKDISINKLELQKFFNTILEKAPDLFVSVLIDINSLDQKIVSLCENLFCSLEIPLLGLSKQGALLLDKKFYSNKIKLLNDKNIIFGFDMEFAKKEGDTFKLFRDRLDFALSLFPNHIDFYQIENPDKYIPPKPTGIFSSKDIDFAKGMAFACKTFYSCGRAVPWFNSVLKVLKISPSSFFADFEEWQQCNNCSFEGGFNPENLSHQEIEKMQINFIKVKLSEKHKESYLPAIIDIIKLNGALSRLSAENEESIVESSYNPDDIFSPVSLDISFFVENVTMENCKVKFFINSDYMDYKIL